MNRAAAINRARKLLSAQRGKVISHEVFLIKPNFCGPLPKHKPGQLFVKLQKHHKDGEIAVQSPASHTPPFLNKRPQSGTENLK